MRPCNSDAYLSIRPDIDPGIGVMSSFGKRYRFIVRVCDRLELLIVTLTLPATTDPFRPKLNIHNITDQLCP